MRKNDTDSVRLDTPHGVAEALWIERNPQGDQWVIRYPWGYSRFLGPKPHLISRMQDQIREIVTGQDATAPIT